MALEDVLTKLIASLDANTAAVKGSKSVPSAAVVAPAVGKAEAEKKPAVIDFDAVKVAAAKVMDKQGKPFAKKIISDVGKAKELASVKPEKYPALVKAFEAALSEDAAEEEEVEEDEL